MHLALVVALAFGLNSDIELPMAIIATDFKLEPELEGPCPAFGAGPRAHTVLDLRAAIERFVDQEERCESFRADALAAWSEYQTTGQHVTGAEADAWLARLETGEAADPPRCHN